MKQLKEEEKANPLAGENRECKSNCVNGFNLG